MKTKVKYWLVAFVGIGLLIFGFLFINQDLQAQKNDSGNKKPDVHIKVNKKTDKNGNIVQYDSAYSYSWSSNGMNKAQMDSIMRQFEGKFSMQDHFFNFNDSDFNFSSGFGSMDSLFSQNFGKNSFEFSNKQFEKMMQEQDAFMKQFFKQHNFDREPLFKVPEEPKQKATPKTQSYGPSTDL